MDQKSRLWKKRSTEKTLAAEKATTSFTNDEEDEETEELLTEKAEAARDLKILSEKLSAALSDCNSKDNTAKKQVKIAQEAIAGWEKAKREAMSLKYDLDTVLQQKAASEERSSQVDAALKECMQQLRFVREEQEKRIHGAVIKTSEEFERTRIALNEKLAEANKRIAKLDAENTQFHRALSGKDKVIADLSKYRTKVEADFNALMVRVESTEKENASLKYEVRVLEKELDIRNEEAEVNRRTADIAQKQHQESVKKVAKLESECQRLRLLVRRRLPGPAAFTKMKNEVEMLGKDQLETRRRRSNPSIISSVDFRVDVAADSPSKRINFLTEQLLRMEEENRSLQYALINKSSELQFSRDSYARTASRLSQGDPHVEGSLIGQIPTEPGKYSFLKQGRSLSTLSDLGSDDKASCAESWASALISELEQFKNEKHLGTPSNRFMGTPEMNLMDDFAEMEKLAIVSLDYPPASPHHSSDEGNAVIPSGERSSPTIGREMVPVHCCPSSGREIHSENTAAENGFPGTFSDLLKMLMEHCRALQRKPHEVLEDMKVALEQNSSVTTRFNDEGSKNHLDAAYSHEVSRDVSQTSNKSFNLEVSDTGNENDMASTKKNDQKLESNVSVPICKILELLEGINLLPRDNGAAESFSGKDDKLPYKSSAMPTGYMVRVFQWKTAELSAILHKFFQTCNDLMNGKADLEQFVQLLASSLEWVMNHCFSLQDVSSMKDAIRSHLDWDESRSESEVDSGSTNHSAESTRLNIQREDVSYIPMVSPLSGHDPSRHLEALPPNTEEEKDIMRQSIGNTGDQIEKLKMMKEGLETQLMETSLEWRKARQQISATENDPENASNSSERQEETCNDRKTQLSKTSRVGQNEGEPLQLQLRNDWEITAASEKLAECQETILNLGKQLKALASPGDAALFDKVISTPADSAITSTPTPRRTLSKRLSLQDKMLEEDNDQIGSSPKTTDNIQNENYSSAVSTNAAIEPWSKFTDPNGTDHEANTTVAVSMAIVPRKKFEGRSLLKKLFLWKKKGSRKKAPSLKQQ